MRDEPAKTNENLPLRPSTACAATLRFPEPLTMARRGGWRREGLRKPFRYVDFRYVDSKGSRIQDEDRLARIEALVIPPAWTDVWISANAAARLQATGIDAAGRRQYLYHPDFRARQEQVKYDQLVRFGELLPSFRERAVHDLEEGPYGRNWACAVAATLINRGWFRVGSERYADRAYLRDLDAHEAPRQRPRQPDPVPVPWQAPSPRPRVSGKSSETQPPSPEPPT